jgi:SAM-dependent methyltransferase
VTLDDLLDDDCLERSEVVANAAMNRGRGLSGVNSYGRDLGFDVLAFLRERRRSHGAVSWLDLCCGQGRALIEAARTLAGAGEADGVRIVGVDLVPMFDPAGGLAPPLLTLDAAPVLAWEPPAGVVFDLVTCVHGLHYVGDKLGALARAASWLAPDGLLLAHLDTANVRIAGAAGDGGKAVRAALRAAGFTFGVRTRVVARAGRGAPVVWPLRYLGADDTAGPNFTRQPAVHSHYAPE